MTETMLDTRGWEWVDPGGVPKIIDVAAPGANTNALISVEGHVWEPVAIAFTLTTDANAANRIVEVDYEDVDGLVVCRNGPGTFITASTTAHLCGKAHQGFSDFTSSGSDLTPVYFPLEPMKLDVGLRIAIVVGNKQAADALTQIALAVRRFDI